MLDVSSRDITEIEIPGAGWRPRPYQRPLWDYLKNGGKRAVAVWHRRAGKDSLCLNWAARCAVQKTASFWHMLPEQKQGRKVIWNAVNPHTGQKLIDQAFPPAIRKRTLDDEMFIELKNGSTWQVVGSDNYNSLMGATPYGVVFSEWALAKPAAWDFISPILAENGGWALFIFTPRGYNHGWDMYQAAKKAPGWFHSVQTVDDTQALPASVIEDERARGYPEEFIQQEYYCSFTSPLAGAFWGHLIDDIERRGQITEVKHTREFPVHTAWDLGRTDDTAIWFYQPTFLGIRIVDCYAASGKEVPHFADVLRRKADEHGYNYGTHHLPHDAKAKSLGVGERTIAIQLAELVGREHVAVHDVQKVEDGIQAARAILPRCWFDAEKCDKGLKALRAYQREWDEDKRCFKEKPLHNWASHYADAFRYLAMVYTDENPTTPVEPTFRNPSLDEIYERKGNSDKKGRGRI